MADGERRGAYGFELQAVGPDREPLRLPHLGPAAPGAPTVLLDYRLGCGIDDKQDIGGGRRHLESFKGGGVIDVDLVERTILLVLPWRRSSAMLVHPYLTAPLAALAHADGNIALHGGVFVVEGRGWVVTGEPTAGKSSLLTGLASRDVPVLADDLAVIGGGVVRSGPTCIDLRPDAAATEPRARSIGWMNDRERFRVVVPPGPPEVPFGGLVTLAWGTTDSDPAVEELDPRQALVLLHEQNHAAPVGPPHPLAVLDVLGRPILRLSRPRDWARADAALDVLLTELAQRAPAT